MVETFRTASLTKDGSDCLRRAEDNRYDRDRSASPRPPKREEDYSTKRDDGYRGGRDRSASPNGRMDSR